MKAAPPDEEDRDPGSVSRWSVSGGGSAYLQMDSCKNWILIGREGSLDDLVGAPPSATLPRCPAKQ
jgi:hypothetical protein